MKHVGYALESEAPRPGHLKNKHLSERLAIIDAAREHLKRAAQRQDLPSMVDALVEIVYSVKATARLLGVDWRAHWCAAHDANMRKTPQATSRAALDAVAPESWSPPPHSALLVARGYDFHEWHEFTSALGELSASIKWRFRDEVAR